MKFNKILVTGGAGFIGSHIVDKLIEAGYQVTILDKLDSQVHQNGKPDYLNRKVKFIKGDITNLEDLSRALEGVDAIYHEAAVVGVGQSMYEIERYVFQNTFGTARLLDYLANHKHQVKRIIVASSMSSYGEGLYRCPKCGQVRPTLRDDPQMRKKDWELHCPNCEMYLSPIGISEIEKFSCNSIYAITKQSQEDMVMVFSRAYGIPATAFRYFNVYGPRQSLSNPYTGVAAIFLSRLKNNQPPVIYEDGLQSRDFISVYDIAEANLRVLENERCFGQVYNLGTGFPVAIKHIARILAALLGKNINPKITSNFRSGDVRHCYPSIDKLKEHLNWSPVWNFEEGMVDLIKWGRDEKASDLFEQASEQLQQRNLIKN